MLPYQCSEFSYVSPSNPVIQQNQIVCACVTVKRGIPDKLPNGDIGNCSNYRGEIDPLLSDQQARLRSNRSCMDQIATLRIIVEQSLEWNSSLNNNFVDYEKAFDSMNYGHRYYITA